MSAPLRTPTEIEKALLAFVSEQNRINLGTLAALEALRSGGSPSVEALEKLADVIGACLKAQIDLVGKVYEVDDARD